MGEKMIATAKAALEALRPRLGRAFSSLDPTLEVNLLGYGVGVGSLCFCLIYWTVKGNRDTALVGFAGVVAAAITGGLFKKGSNASAEPPKGDQP